MTYGVLPTGYARKPLSVILAEIEAAMVTEFGPAVIQTAQSPLGQINGLMADIIAELDELVLDVYQSYDPDQAEGSRLDTLARMRQISRNGRTDAAFRRAITNEGLARVDLADILSAIRSIEGVTFAAFYSNESSRMDENGLDPGALALVVMGGDDEEIAHQARVFLPPGTLLYGTHWVNTSRDGQCRSIGIVRPVVVPVEVKVSVMTRKDISGCPPPSYTAIATALAQDWSAVNYNGKDVTNYSVRTLIECRFPNVEVLDVTSSRDGLPFLATTSLGFIEISELSEITVAAARNPEISPPFYPGEVG